MAYRVGYQCVATQLQADDLILSALPPAINEQGQIVRPIRKTDGWYLNNVKLQLSHPQCDVSEQITNGAQISAFFVVLIVVAFGIRQIIKFISSLSSVGSGEE